jgi:hypothetical protein
MFLVQSASSLDLEMKTPACLCGTTTALLPPFIPPPRPPHLPRPLGVLPPPPPRPPPPRPPNPRPPPPRPSKRGGNVRTDSETDGGLFAQSPRGGLISQGRRGAEFEQPPPKGRGFRGLAGVGFEEGIGAGRFYRMRLGFMFDRGRWCWRC